MHFEVVTIILLIIGVLAILFSCYYNNICKHEIKDEVNKEYSKEYYDEYGARIEELNRKILEINEYGEFMLNELEKKHKELLFLYQLINEKTKEIEGMETAVSLNQDEDLYENKLTNNPKRINYNQMIIEFSEKGYNIKEIAQLLDIGQGEVKLVLELYERGEKNEKG